MSARTTVKEETSCKIQSAKAGEHAQARRALAALAGDTHSVPSTHVSIKICCNSSSRRPNTFSGLCGHGGQILRYTCIHTKLIFSQLIFLVIAASYTNIRGLVP